MESLFVIYREVWAVDFEFAPDDNLLPKPVCLVARELKSGREVRLWREQFGDQPPYSTRADGLFFAYYASAQIGCHLALGWPVPQRILDLFCEFRRATNGLALSVGNGLLGALTHHGLDSLGASEKEEMRDLILSGGPWSDDQRHAILDYCASDVDALARLLVDIDATKDHGVPGLELFQKMTNAVTWRCGVGRSGIDSSFLPLPPVGPFGPPPCGAASIVVDQRVA